MYGVFCKVVAKIRKYLEVDDSYITNNQTSQIKVC